VNHCGLLSLHCVWQFSLENSRMCLVCMHCVSRFSPCCHCIVCVDFLSVLYVSLCTLSYVWHNLCIRHIRTYTFLHMNHVNASYWCATPMVYISMHKYIYIFACIYIYVCICVNMHICVCMCAYICYTYCN